MSDPVAVLERRRNGLPAARQPRGPLGRRVLTNPATWVFVVMTAVYIACLYWQYHTITQPITTENGEVPGINYAAVRDATTAMLDHGSFAPLAGAASGDEIDALLRKGASQ